MVSIRIEGYVLENQRKERNRWCLGFLKGLAVHAHVVADVEILLKRLQDADVAA